MCIHPQTDYHAPSAFGQVCTLLLQSPQHNCAQDAATFSRLLCVSQQLRETLLHAAVGCIQAQVPRCCSSASTDRCFVQWLCKQWEYGTLKTLQVDADDFFPDLSMQLAEQLQVLQLHQQQPQLLSSADRMVQQQVGAGVGLHTGQGPPAACGLPSAGLPCEQFPAPAPAAAPVWFGPGQSRRTPSIFVSWHVCGLPPSSLPMLPGAILTHLTLRDSTLSPATAQSLAQLQTLQQLHLPNLNPISGTLAPALSALTSLTCLFIRHPCPPEQQALPLSLQQLTVAQRTPPWIDEGPQDLEPLHISHLTALTSLTIHEVVPQGITEQYKLPTSLQHISVVCVSCAGPLLGLRQLVQLRVSSLKHSSPAELLKFSSLPALTALKTGCAEDGGAVASSVRLAPADIRAFRQVFAAVPVFVTALTVQEDAEAGGRGLCRSVLRALCSLNGLRSLSLLGLPHSRASTHQQPSGHRGFTAAELSKALSALTELTQLRLSHLQLARPGAGPCQLSCTAQWSGANCINSAAASAAAAATADGSLWLAPAQQQDGSSSSGGDSQGSQQLQQGFTPPAAAVTAAAAQPARVCDTGQPHTACGAVACAESSYCSQQGWQHVLSSLARLPSLRMLTCTGLPLGSAVSSLSALVHLQILELRDCDVPPAVVAGVAACLAVEGRAGCHSSAGSDTSNFVGSCV